MSSPEKNKAFLIIRLSSFGDVLLTTGTLRSIKARFPDSIIHFVVKKTFSVMIKSNPLIDELIHYEDSEKNDHLNTTYYDHILDLQNNVRSHRLTKKLKYKFLDRYEKHRISRFFHIQFGYKGFNTPLESVPQKYVSPLKKYEYDLKDFGPEFIIENTDYYKSIDLKRDDYIVMAPGAAHFTKQWPVEYYIDLIHKIREQEGSKRIVLLGGQAEQDTASLILDKCEDILNLVGVTTFDESASIIAASQIVVCNDSSIMHLAAALEKKVLVFFGSTTEIFGFFPYTTKYAIMENLELRCRPCSHIGRNECPKHHFKCMTGLKPKKALEKMNELLEVTS